MVNPLSRTRKMEQNRSMLDLWRRLKQEQDSQVRIKMTPISPLQRLVHRCTPAFDKEGDLVGMGFFHWFFLVLIGAFVHHVLKRDPPPIFGVYRRPGKWYYVKVLVFRALLWLRKVEKEEWAWEEVPMEPTALPSSSKARVSWGLHGLGNLSVGSMGRGISLLAPFVEGPSVFVAHPPRLIHSRSSLRTSPIQLPPHSRTRQTHLKRKGSGSAGLGFGRKKTLSPLQMDGLRPLSNHPKAIDAVYFSGASEEGCYLVGAAARRPQGVVDGYLHIRIPGVGLLRSPKLPDTTLKIDTDAGDDEDQFGAEGLLFTPLEPMRRWGIRYHGPMKLDEKTVQVDLQGEWISDLAYFDFDTDLSPGTLARSLAKEPWSREYFQRLRDTHQNHYEQMGRIEGSVRIHDTEYSLRLDSMRDHTHGMSSCHVVDLGRVVGNSRARRSAAAEKRDWSHMHRYGFHTFFLEDGTKGNVGVASLPLTCSLLEVGYVYARGGELVPVDSVDLPLWQHGEGGMPPKDYAFSFCAGGKQYWMEVKVLESPELLIAADWEARVVLRMVAFTCNRLKGWGVAEWQYCNPDGRRVQGFQRSS
ncbi:unnamed protein product [Darwinula stevensoni]|uniref:Uncharacterized protein n=1 Tax=Darwinula stevensoni TaxID=69355 RepID=A0A7R9AF36_9CRUS|nr:unnamed protein product [Darwinula stevensoni]CAG0902649.1 unnamed protein product [Darwinula stevensoni]